MRPFIIITTSRLLVEDKPSMILPCGAEEALRMQQSLEYGRGIQAQVITTESKPMNLGHGGSYPL